MGDLVLELIPAMLGLLVTPVAIAGGILLLGTTRPFANALAFLDAFLLAYAIIATVVVVLATSGGGPLLSTFVKSVVELLVGVALLLLAAGLAIRGSAARTAREARRAKKSFTARLDAATPPFAFGAGLALAIFNPNVPILVAGLAVVAAADSGQVAGAALLLLAGVGGILIPILWRWLAPRSATAHLDRLRSWIGRHDRDINIAVLLVFGTAFTVKGWAGL